MKEEVREQKRQIANKETDIEQQKSHFDLETKKLADVISFKKNQIEDLNKKVRNVTAEKEISLIT